MVKLKGVSIAVNDMEASLVFYVGLLGMEIDSMREGHVIFVDGIELYSLSRFSELVSLGETDMYFGSSQLVIEFETEYFGEILNRANKKPFLDVEYRVFHDKGKRCLILKDPDLNILIIREKVDNTIKKFENNTDRVDVKSADMVYPSDFKDAP